MAARAAVAGSRWEIPSPNSAKLIADGDRHPSVLATVGDSVDDTVLGGPDDLRGVLSQFPDADRFHVAESSNIVLLRNVTS